ncbi:MAG: hypothetical protein H6739_04945 [Alphaproteobacteria bacterium]|nr:hypothetical protein [Alphaproteobacteria bacterium]
MKLTIVVALCALVSCTRDKDDETGLDDSASGALTALTDPCGGAATPNALHFTSETDGWVGCGSASGVHHTTDGGASFTDESPTSEFYAYQVVSEPDGGLLLCGQGSDSGLVWRRAGVSWTQLLAYDASNTNDVVNIRTCGQVAAAGDGRLIMSGLTSGDITWSTNGGTTWSPAERYWEDANFGGGGGGQTSYPFMRLESVGGQFFGAGGNATHPPVFLGLSTRPDGAFYNMHAYVVDEAILGEVWSMATPDGGGSWLVGGRDQDRSAEASGFLYRTVDGGESWSIPDFPDDIDIVQDIAFHDDGQRGLAVGHRYPPDAGFILYTSDAGQTWEALEDAPTALWRVSIAGDSFWVAGDGYLGMGTL